MSGSSLKRAWSTSKSKKQIPLPVMYRQCCRYTKYEKEKVKEKAREKAKPPRNREKEKSMKKKYKCEVDCAACAAKIEDAIRKIDGVKDANVNFLTQKVMIDADDDRFDDIVQQAVKAAKHVEADAVIYVK